MVRLALRVLLVSMLAPFRAFLEADRIFSVELSKLYRSSRDDSRAQMSSRGFDAALPPKKKKITGDVTSDVGVGVWQGLDARSIGIKEPSVPIANSMTPLRDTT